LVGWLVGWLVGCLVTLATIQRKDTNATKIFRALEIFPGGVLPSEMPRPPTLPAILAETPDGPPPSRSITDRQTAFVDFYATRGVSGAEAARMAGYASPKQEAVRLLQQAPIRHALRQRRESIIHGDLAKLALSTLHDLMERPETPAAVKLGSARTALEMARHLGVAAPKDPALHDRPLSELSVADLQRLVDEGTGVLAALAKDVTPAVVPDGNDGTL
jgi:hypothetical protein